MTFIRRTFFNVLYQPTKIGGRRYKRKSGKKAYNKRSRLYDLRVNKVSRKAAILSRFTYLRMIIIYNILHKTDRRRAKSFMLKRLLD